MITKKRKLEATVATVKTAAGPTWFACSDEGNHIELSTRDNGDVGRETAGKVDKVEGPRPDLTYNYHPPNNVIENAGAIEFEARIPTR